MTIYKVTDWSKLPHYRLVDDVTRSEWMFKNAFKRPHKYSIAQRIVDMLYKNGTILVASPCNFIKTEKVLVFA